MGTPNYTYRTIQVQNRMPFRARPSARARAAKSAVELAPMVLNFIMEKGLNYRIKKELDLMNNEIHKSFSSYDERTKQSNSDVGVLAVAGIKEWVQPDFNGNRAKLFMGIHIAGVGKNAKQAIEEYRSKPGIVQRPPKGWRRIDHYIWVTRNGLN